MIDKETQIIAMARPLFRKLAMQVYTNPSDAVTDFKAYEDTVLMFYFPTHTDMPEGFDWRINGYHRDEVGSFKVIAVKENKFICLDEGHEPFTMHMEDRLPFEAFHFIDSYKRFRRKNKR